jgi:mRNA interferase MazF
MEKDSIVLLEQIRTIDKSRLREKVTYLDDIFMSQVDQALSISFGMNQEQDNQNKRVM